MAGDAYEIEDGRVVRSIIGYPDVASALRAVRGAQ
jgi:hypothetical protein